MNKRVLVVFGLAVALAILFVVTATAAPTAVGADKCKMCHKVQFESWSTSKHAAQTPKIECENCHGLGSDYKTIAIMKDPAKAKEAGLIAKPAKAGCVEKCHKANWKDDMLQKTHAHKAK